MRFQLELRTTCTKHTCCPALPVLPRSPERKGDQRGNSFCPGAALSFRVDLSLALRGESGERGRGAHGVGRSHRLAYAVGKYRPMAANYLGNEGRCPSAGGPKKQRKERPIEDVTPVGAHV